MKWDQLGKEDYERGKLDGIVLLRRQEMAMN